MEQANMGQRHISWKHVWSNFCLSCNNEKLLDDDAVLQDIGVQNKSQVHPYRICSICDEEGSGKTLEEEEASSLLLTPQDLLDSSSRLFPVMKVLVICNGEKMGLPLGLLTMEVLEEPLLYFGHSEIIILSLITRGRGEAIEPSNSSDDRRSTSEVAPQKEVVSFGKRHELTNNYRSVALVNVKLLLPPPYPYHYQG
ncbi:BnaC09g29520D [Brassica napus]|nr:BnaC09g29520D [Brassica napus]